MTNPQPSQLKLKRPNSSPTQPATAAAPQEAAQTQLPTITGANPRDLDRERASIAWSNVQEVKPKAYQAKYGSLARKIPTLIQTNGLGQTLAFLKAKRKDHHNEMFKHLSEWLSSRISVAGTENFLSKIFVMESSTYRLATAEALAFLQWLKRFAEAELDKEEEG
jgi:CRISPR-associated protein Cmr5